MRRGKVELKRIENKISRQVTFSKRRSGLIKKASEISVLCEADVSVIVFSDTGKLFEHSTNSRMESILDIYEGHCHATNPNKEDGGDDLSLETSKLMSRLETIKKAIRNYSGDELDSLSLREVKQLEQDINVSLKRLRSGKNHLIREAIAEKHKKNNSLLHQNKLLKKQVEDFNLNLESNAGQPCSLEMPMVSELVGFNKGNKRVHVLEMNDSVSTKVPHWMLSNDHP